jgi:hypothetical protein
MIFSEDDCALDSGQRGSQLPADLISFDNKSDEQSASVACGVPDMSRRPSCRAGETTLSPKGSK